MEVSQWIHGPAVSYYLEFRSEVFGTDSLNSMRKKAEKPWYLGKQDIHATEEIGFFKPVHLVQLSGIET